MKSIRIANGQGFWGDSIDAPEKLIQYGDIDYLTLDYLAEVTLSIMQRQKLKNPELGYALDFVDLIDNNLELVIKNKIKIICNAGGVNPHKCKEKLLEIAKKKNINLKIAVVEGDDIFGSLDTFMGLGQQFSNLSNGKSFDTIRNNVYSANVYIDSFTIAEALAMGAEIVICGRVSDPGLVVGPCIYEFGIKKDDYNMLASATVAGHILECGAQTTGGNHSNWHDIDDFSNLGYPIAEIKENGIFDIKKPPRTGGLINKQVVTEQILYELGDPKCYISPDVCVDFTSIRLFDRGNDVVRVDNVKGFCPTDTYKVSITYFNGFKASSQLTISGPDAIKKANVIKDAIWKKLEQNNCIYDAKSHELLGLSSCFKDMFDLKDDAKEVVLRLGVKGKCKKSIIRFTKELSPMITAGPPGVTGFSEGRPKVREIVAYWPTLIDKDLVKTSITI